MNAAECLAEEEPGPSGGLASLASSDTAQNRLSLRAAPATKLFGHRSPTLIAARHSCVSSFRWPCPTSQILERMFCISA
jgi:hypothetical protein